jgi:hypothetical protein
VNRGTKIPKEGASARNQLRPLSKKNGYDKTTKFEPTVNYIKLINWIWSEVPYLEGFKATYIALYFAIIDSINTNNWNEVSLPYDYLTNKVRIDKRLYLHARQWLVDNQLLIVQTGKNGFQMAKFSLGSAVLKSTATNTAIDTTTPPLLTPLLTPQLSPIVKQETLNLETLKQIQTVFSEEFINGSWQLWKRYKQESFKFSYKSIETEQAAINQLETISEKNEPAAKQIVEQSICNGWKGFFPLKSSKTNFKNESTSKGIYIPG